MSSSDHTNLLKLRQLQNNNKTSGTLTQSLMMNTIVSQDNNYFQVPISGASAINTGASCSGNNPTVPTNLCLDSLLAVTPGYSSIGRTGPPGPQGEPGPPGPNGFEGPPGLSLEYNLFLQDTGSGLVPEKFGMLIDDPLDPSFNWYNVLSATRLPLAITMNI